MISVTSGSFKSSSSGPKPRSSSIRTFSSANCSRRFSVTLSSASTSMIMGRNSSDSSSLESVAAASGSTRSSRRGSTCSLILWTLASNPSGAPDAFWTAAARSARRSMASAVLPLVGAAGAGAALALGSSPPFGSGGNCSPPEGCSAARAELFIGRATPKAGRPPGFILPALPFFPNALMPSSPRGLTKLYALHLTPNWTNSASRNVANKSESLFFP